VEVIFKASPTKLDSFTGNLTMALRRPVYFHCHSSPHHLQHHFFFLKVSLFIVADESLFTPDLK
jgi:hypothetical protein